MSGVQQSQSHQEEKHGAKDAPKKRQMFPESDEPWFDSEKWEREFRRPNPQK